MVTISGVYAQGFPEEGKFYYDTNQNGANVQDWSIKDQVSLAVIDAQWPIQRLIKIFIPNRPAGEWVLEYVAYIINIALWLVAFIAVIVLIYWFYGILFSDSKDGISNAQKTIKWAAIAIILMWASWLIVKIMFYIITLLQ